MTLGEYLAIWLETYVEPFRRPSTVACYDRAARTLPRELTQRQLTELDGLNIQRALNHKALKHPRAAQLQFAMLHAALKRAQRLRLVDESPMMAVDKPLHKARKATVLSAEELRQYLSVAKNERVYPLLLCIALLGLRRGEALALTWSAISGEALRIEQQRLRQPGKGLQLVSLKSESSRRTLPIAPELRRDLDEWRQRQQVYAIGGYVCDATPEALAKAHKRVIAAAKLPAVTLHGLRHTMAALLAASGTPIKVLQGILGHAQYKLTADLYADHLTPEAFRYDLAKMAQVCNYQATGRV